MAVTATLLAAHQDTSNATSYTDADSTTPTANRGLVWAMWGRTTTPADPTSVSAYGLTWTKLTHIDIASLGRLVVYTAYSGSSPSTSQASVTYPGAHVGWTMSITQLDGVDMTDFTVQQPTGSGSSNTASVTLSAFADATNNACLMFAASTVNEAMTPDTTSGWAELNDGGHNSPTSRMATEWRTGQDLTATYSWTTSAQWVAIAIEIKAAAVTQPIAFDAASSGHGAADFIVVGSGAATISFEAATSLHAATDLTVEGSGAVPIIFDPVTSLHAATEFILFAALPAQTITFDAASTLHTAAEFTVLGAGAALIGFDPASTLHAGSDVIVVGGGAAALPFDPAASLHASSDFITIGSGAVAIPFDAAASLHQAIDFLTRASGGAPISFDPASTLHQATDFTVFAPVPGAIAFEAATTLHAALDFILRGSGAATIAFDSAGSLHAGTDVLVVGSSGAALGFDPATSLHSATDFLLLPSGAATVLFDPASTLHFAAGFAVVYVISGLVVVRTAGAGNVPIQWKNPSGSWQQVLTNIP